MSDLLLQAEREERLGNIGRARELRARARLEALPRLRDGILVEVEARP